MISFILVALLITVVAVFILIWPLLRPVESDAYERHTQNVHFARERLDELEQQLAESKISQEDYEALRSEIETTLANDLDLADAEHNKANEATQSSGNAVVITLICCLLPISGFILYLITGTPDAIGNVSAQSTTSNPAEASQNLAANAEIGDLVASLEVRLENQPEDIQGWTILARTYQQLGRYEEAVTAYQRLTSLTPDNADNYAGLADASALLAGGTLAGTPSVYIDKALQLNPQHPQALWLAGLSRAQGGNGLGALEYWERLHPLLAEFPQQQAELNDVIAQTRLATEEQGQSTSATPPAPPQPFDQDSVNSQITAARENKIEITVNVSIADNVLQLVSPADTVFVFARAKQGPPAPLAVKRLQVRDLPASVTLSEKDGMIPQLTLAQFENIVLSARVAKSGNPIAQSGDLQSQLLDATNDISSPVSLTIENEIK